MQDEMEKLARWHDGRALYSPHGTGDVAKHTDAAATIRAAMGEIERLREGLRECRRAVDGGRDEPRHNVREIVGRYIEEHDRALKKGPAHD